MCGGLFLILISTGVMFFLLPPDTNSSSSRGIHHFETDDGTVRQLLAGKFFFKLLTQRDGPEIKRFMSGDILLWPFMFYF